MRTLPLASSLSACGLPAPAARAVPLAPPFAWEAACSGTTTPGSRKPSAGLSAVTVISGSPTESTAPGSACSVVTTPAKGTGTSTTALAVSTSAMTWSTSTRSPGTTCQATTSASLRPSPRSGSRKSGIVPLPLQARDGVEDAVGVGQVELLQMRRRVRDVEASDPQDRCLQVMEALLGQPGGDLRAVAGEARRLVHDDGPASPAHRLRQGVVVEGRQRAEVDDLDIPAFLKGGRGRLQRGGDHPAVGDQRDVLARAPHYRPVNRRSVDTH